MGVLDRGHELGFVDEALLALEIVVEDGLRDLPEYTFFDRDDRITDDPKVRRPDNTKAREILEWEPKVNLADGLKQTIEYFKPRI